MTDADYRFATVVGDYVFSKARPYLLEYRTLQGEVLVDGSSFVVLAPGISLFQSPRVLNASDYNYTVRYGFSAAAAGSGDVTITYEFRDDGAPKISARLNQTQGASLSLIWFAFTSDRVAMSDAGLVDFGALPQPIAIAGSTHQLWVGPDQDVANWTRRVLLDWSDAEAGQGFVGSFAAGDLTASAAAFVVFPAGMSVVDPSLNGWSGTETATDYSIQRKGFAYGGFYWAFWYDGSNIVYSSSRDGVTWGSLMSTGSEAIAGGFDVDQRDGAVLVGYVPSNKLSLKVLKGILAASSAAWSSATTVTSWSISEAGPPTVAIGTDGYYWAAVLRRVTATETRLYVYRSTDAGSTSFGTTPSLSNSVAGSPLGNVVRVLALPNGNAYVVVAGTHTSGVTTWRYSDSGWGFYHDWWSLFLASDAPPGDILAAVGLPDSAVRIVYRYSTGELRTTRISSDDSSASTTTLDTRSSLYPTIILDPNGESHVFYRYTESPTSHRILYARQRPSPPSTSTESWAAALEPFPASTVTRRSLTALPFGPDRIAVLWTETSSSTSGTVKFGSLPAPLDFGSQTGVPWDRQGISPFQSYFSQFSEYVSPGSGLLTLKQTDLFIPGRGLNLEVSRVFVTPRAFDKIATAPAAALFEDSPAANLGKGWSLNFPWISEQYVHLWDGQMYVMRWRGNVFENHEGEHFVMTRDCFQSCYSSYTLHTKSGVRFVFTSDKKLSQIQDVNGNGIWFTYVGGVLDTMTDSAGRTVKFSYLSGKLDSITSGSRKWTYGYQTIAGVTVLSSVRDPMNRVTSFEYLDSRTPHLLTKVIYPTGGRSAYTWSTTTIDVGPDFQSFFVTLQDNQNGAGQSVRSNVFDYMAVNGKVTYVKVTTSESEVPKGSTTFSFDSGIRRSTSIRRDAAGVQLGRTVSWFDEAGATGQVDVYPGASTSSAYSVHTAFDEWGNLIYSRDALGHERFSSFANTLHQGGFYAPGRITRTTPGLLFFDDFEDRDLSDWSLTTSAGTVTLDNTIFESVPPTAKVAHDGRTTGVASMTHTFESQPGTFVAEAYIRPEETVRQHYILLDSSTSTRVYVSLRDNGYLSWWSGTVWNDVPGATYRAKQWYRIAFEIDVANNRYDIWFNNKEVKTGATMTGTGSIDRLRIQASCSGCGAATTFVDTVKVYKNLQLTVTGLRPGQIVKFVDSLARVASTVRVASGATTATISLSPGTYPYGTLRVYDEEWNPEFLSPTHEFWGGETWSYTPPWESLSLTRTRIGFLRIARMYVDDGTPDGAVRYDAQDGWDWGAYDYPILNALDHRSKYLTGTHQHYFQDATSTMFLVSGDFLIQYIYIPENEVPSEIMLQFQDSGTDPNTYWNHRAYWGANLIPWGADQTTARWRMGDIPGQTGRWLALAVKADTVGMVSRTLEGLAYTLYGGRAIWDVSGRGDWMSGRVEVHGLTPGWQVELYDAAPPHAYKGTSDPATSSGIAYLQMYDWNINVFPFDGYIIIRDTTGAGVYQSPALSLWGGDIYTYSATKFYSHGTAGIGPYETGVGHTVHDRLVGALEYQTGRGASPEKPIEAYVGYDVNANPDRLKVWDGTSWAVSTFTYTIDGLPASVTDPNSNTVTYYYAPAYNRAYVTRVSDGVGTVARYTYDPATGWPLAQRNARGYMTRYGYDPIGRATTESRFDLPASSEVLYLDMDWTTEDAPPRLEDLSGRGNHGTISGPTLTAGKVGGGRAFDGTDDVVTVAAASSLNAATFSAALWFSRDTSTTNQGLIGKASFPNSWRVWTRTDGKIEADAKSDTVGNLVSQTTVVAGTWYHVALTFDGTTARLYVNGVQEASATTADWGGPYNAALWVGDTDSTSPFDGTIDEARVFNVALSSPDISALYTNSYRLLTSAEVAYDDVGNSVTIYDPTTNTRQLHLDMQTYLGGKLEDLSGHGRHGTVTGTAPGGGAYGGAGLWFDGIDDRIDTPLSPTPRGTIAFWAKPDTLDWWRAPVGIKISGSNPADPAWGPDRFFVVNMIPGTETGDGQPRWRAISNIDGTAHAWLISQTIPSTSRMDHIAVTWDEIANTMALYVNGNLEAGPLTVTDNPSTLGEGWRVGAERPGSGQFKGTVDEVHVFDRALASPEILALYQGTETGAYHRQYFDSIGRVTTVVRRDLFGALTSTASFAYNFRDQVLARTVARDGSTSFTTAFEYDFLGRPTKVTYPDFPSNPLTVRYDDVSRIRTVVAENGRAVQYVSDLAGRTTAVREYQDAVGYTTTAYAYDEAGNLVSVTNALSQVTTHAYDNLNRLTRTTYPDTTKFEAYTYDGVGNLRTRRDRAGVTTTYGYDARYRLTSVDYSSTPVSPDVSYAYDGNDNPTSATNPSATLAFTYDGLDRVRTETSTIAGVAYPVGYEYDAAGRLTRLTYPGGFALDYTYDAFGRTYQAKSSATTYATFSYFADDLIQDVVLDNGILQSYAYNGRGWPTSLRATSGTTTYLDLPYTYDPSGNVLSMGTTSFAYDRLDRLKTALGPFGSHFYDHDAVGNRKRLDTVFLRPNGAGSTTKWAKSGSGGANWDRVDEATSDGDSTYVYESTVGDRDLYALQDNTATGTINAVTVTAVARAVSATSCEPNCVGSIKLRIGGSATGESPVKSVGTSYEAVSHTWTTKPGGGAWTDADLDNLQAGIELASGGTSSTVRDTQVYVTVNVGDSVTYAYADGTTGMSTLTSLTKAGSTTSFAYDANGNLDTKTGGWDYDWNPENLMTVAKLNGAQQQAYVYDGLGRRVKVDGTSSSWTVSIYSGMDPIYEKDQSGVVTKYVYANGMRIARIDCTAVNPPVCTTVYYLGDHLGSTRQVRDSSRGLVFSAEYEPFGKPYSTTGTETYKFTMEKHDDPTGLVYLRARQYDPEIGRFVSADPVLGVPALPQTLNRYAYVVNNPLKYTDPTGEFWFQNPVGDWWDGLDSDTRAVIIIVAVAAAIVLTAGIAAVPLAGTALGSILMTAAIGAAIGAFADAALYTGITMATGGQWSFEGMAQAAAIGALVGGVTAGAGKAFSLWRAGALAGRISGVAYDGAQASSKAFQIAEQGGRHAGFLRRWANAPTEQLLKTRLGLLGQIEKHIAKVRSPANYIDDWGSLTRIQQAGKVRHWETEIMNWRQQVDIIEDLLSIRGAI